MMRREAGTRRGRSRGTVAKGARFPLPVCGAAVASFVFDRPVSPFRDFSTGSPADAAAAATALMLAVSGVSDARPSLDSGSTGNSAAASPQVAFGSAAAPPSPPLTATETSPFFVLEETAAAASLSRFEMATEAFPPYASGGTAASLSAAGKSAEPPSSSAAGTTLTFSRAAETPISTLWGGASSPLSALAVAMGLPSLLIETVAVAARLLDFVAPAAVLSSS
mmetsp:Transcript_14467/g.28948  ORF Transcript_14467/g.28948 Transcript_14467/m.28948 type:complete len:223 (-) Transcript_14467:613-1281(-)